MPRKLTGLDQIVGLPVPCYVGQFFVYFGVVSKHSYCKSYKIGPRIVPWGTLQRYTRPGWEDASNNNVLQTNAVMSRRYRDILIWATAVCEAQLESIAIEKYKNITSLGLDLFLDDAKSSKQHSNWVRVDFLSRKPNWLGLKTFRACQKSPTLSLTISPLT